MSRTDAHRPGWVQQFDPSVPASIRHDHTSGVCREETLEWAQWEQTRPRSHSWRCCAKYEVVPDECPHDPRTPARFSACYTIRDRHRTWLALDRDLVQEGVPFYYRPWFNYKHPVHTHTKRVYHDDWPCHCDDWPEAPTCEYRFDRRYWQYVSSVYGKGVPGWYLHESWHGPERRREREGLHMLAREYNTYGEVADGDFDCPQARHRAHYHWW